MSSCSNRVARCLAAALLALSGLASALGLESGDVERRVVPLAKGSASANLVGFQSGVAVVEFDGDYDRNLPSGDFNVAPRQAVAEAALPAFGDDVDFLVVLSSFDWDLGGAGGFAVTVANDVSGIGLPIVDHSAAFGSGGRLQLYVDLGPLDSHELDPVRPDFEGTLILTLHELFHRWLFAPEIDHAVLAPDGLLGHQSAHWSYLADSDASLLYGADWRDNGDGTHTAVQILRRLAPLDLYLAGFARADEVPPFWVLDSPGVDPAGLPELAATIPGNRIEVTVDDVLSALGQRVPTSADAQKHFRVGLVALVRQPNEPVPITAITRLGREVATRFSILTAGRGTLAIAGAGVDGEPGEPSPVGGGGPTLPTLDLETARLWLRERQLTDGSWADSAATTVRDTALAARTLAALDPTFSGTDRALASGWLGAVETDTVDGLAHALLGSAALGGEPAAVSARVASLIGAGMPLVAGGRVAQWGPGHEHRRSIFDSGVAVYGLDATGWNFSSSPTVDIAAARGQLRAAQNQDGGWGVSEGGASRLVPTARALSTVASSASPDAIGAAAAWLASRQGPDGGFGDDDSSAWATALALEALLDAGQLDQVDLLAAIEYLSTHQSLDGSWEGSVATTAAVAWMLPRLVLPDLAFVGAPSAIPPSIAPGEIVRLVVEATNRGSAPSPATTLRWALAGSPNLTVADVAVPSLLPLQRLVLETTWDTTGSEPGERVLTATLDPEETIVEANELDNQVSLELAIAEPPIGPDLSVASAEIALVPQRPDHLPSDVELTAVVRNIGSTSATAVRVAIASVAGATHAEFVVDIEALSTALVHATIPVTDPAPFSLAVLADADESIAEDNEDNNLAVVVVDPLPTFDAVVDEVDLTVTPVDPKVGEEVAFGVAARNRGTLDLAALRVRFDLLVDDVLVHTESWTEPVSAGGQIGRTVPWLADRIGAGRAVVTADPLSSIAELDEGNNSASRSFAIVDPTESNLVVETALTLDPEPPAVGRALGVAATVRNSGGLAAAFDVALYVGDPAMGGTEVARVAETDLAPGESRVVDLEWPLVPDTSTRLLFVVADPDGAVAETREDDNQAWVEVHPASLPDLALSASSLSLDPSFPLAGEEALISVEVANLGGQAAEDVPVRVQVDGALIAESVLQNVPALGLAVAVLPWTTPDDRPTVELSVEIDPGAVIAELDESNNAAAMTIVLQAGAASVDERYFSPNGDGVKDSTLLTFRLETADAVVVEVRDRHGRVVREEDLGSVAIGSWRWDGKDGFGRLVADGQWSLVVAGAGGDLAATTVVVDTNRASLIDAIAADLVSELNATCALPPIQDWTLGANDRLAVFQVFYPNPLLDVGLYRRSLTPGSPSSLIVDAQWFADRNSRLGEWISDPKSSAVAFVARSVGFNTPHLWLSTAQGALVDTGLEGSPFGFVSGTEAVLVETPEGSRVYSPASGLGQLLPRPFYAEDVITSGGRPEIAPTGDRFVGIAAGQLVVVEIASGTVAPLPGAPLPDSESSISIAWRRDGRFLAVGDGLSAELRVFDGSVVAASAPIPPLPPEVFGYPPDAPPFPAVGVGFPSWSSGSDEIVVQSTHEVECDRAAASWVFSLATNGWTLLGATPPAEGCFSFEVSRTDGASLGTVHHERTRSTRWVEIGEVGESTGGLELLIAHRGPAQGLVDGAILEIDGWRAAPDEVVGAEAVLLARVDRAEADLTGRSVVLRWDRVPPGVARLRLVAREPMSGSTGLAAPGTVGVLGREGGSLAKSSQVPILPAGRAEFLPWTRHVAILGNEEVVILDLDHLDVEPLRILGGHDYLFDPRLSPTGASLLFGSSRDLEDPESGCDPDGNDDDFVYRSLANLENELGVEPLEAGPGYRLLGTATDLNFERRRLEGALLGDPDSALPIGVPSGQMAFDQQVGVWAPPSSGSWLIRQLVEDLAGNQRLAEKRVEVAGTAVVADLLVEPELLAPALVPLSIRYRLLAPFQAAIQVLNRDDVVVRTIPVSHPCCAGDVVEQLWNGRDEHGALVPDGLYRIALLGFEIPIVVDGTAPTISELLVAGPSHGEMRVNSGGAPTLVVSGTVALTVEEVSDSPFLVERGLGAHPLSWELWQSTGCDASLPCLEWESSVHEAAGRSFRVTARDRAGNTSQRQSGVVPEEIAVYGVGPIVVGPTGSRAPLSPIQIIGPAPQLSTELHALAVAETIIAGLSRVDVQYHPSGSTGWLGWQVLGFLAPGGTTALPEPVDGRFEIPFEPLDLLPGVVQEVRLRTIDLDGAEHFSAPIRVRPIGVEFVGLADAGLDPEVIPQVVERDVLLASLASDGEGLAWARHWLDVPIAQATLVLWSEEDLRYLIPVRLPLLAAADEVLLFELPENLEPAMEYLARVELTSVPVTPLGGGVPGPISVSDEGSVEIPPLRVEVAGIAPRTRGFGCGQRFDEGIRLDLVVSVDPGVPLVLLTVERILPSGQSDVVATVPAPLAATSIELATSEWPEGAHELVVRVVDAAENEHEKRTEVVVDRSVPSPRVIWPAPGTSSCSAVDLSVEVADTGTGTKTVVGELGSEPNDSYGPFSDRLHPWGETTAQVVPSLRTSQTLTEISSVDGSGNIGCTAIELAFDLAAAVGLQDPAPSGAFSPDADGIRDELALTAIVGESYRLGVEYSPAMRDTDPPCVSVGLPVHSRDFGWLSPGQVAFDWDGVGSSAVVPDGLYVAELSGEDACSHAPRRTGSSFEPPRTSACVWVDTVAPLVAVTSPTPAAHLPIVAEIWGSAIDATAGVVNWAVEFGEGADPAAWSRLAEGDQAVPYSRKLADWNTFGLSGDFTLRLIADDGVGHVGEVRVPVTLATPAVFVSDLAATPSPFSPNGDGRRETATVRLTVETTARFRVSIEDENESLVRMLSDSTLEPGIRSLVWNGQNAGGSVAPDGLYRVVVEAFVAPDPAPLQAESVTLLLDASAPALAIEDPLVDGFVDVPHQVTGSVADPLLAAWALALAPADLDDWSMLAESTLAVDQARLADLDELAEGSWRLRFEAEDLAENRSSLLVPFTVDRTPPAVTLTAPLDGLLFGSGALTIPVLGVVADDHLATWTLVAFPQGSIDPSARVSIASGTDPIEGSLADLVTSLFADGAWTLELAGEDRAGHRTVATVTIGLDRTPPEVSIVSPAAGSWVRGAGPVLGAVADPHLVDWRLAVAAGAAPLPGSFATIAVGHQPVEGVLGQWLVLPADGPATLSLWARDAVGNEATTVVQVELDTVPPPRPLALTATKVAPRDVELSWSAVADPHLAGYLLERDEVRITPLPLAGPPFVDAGVADGIHEYRVVAVDLAGNESPPSSPAVVVIDTTPPLVAMTAPSEGGWIRGATEILGTAASTQPDFAEYWVEVGSDALGWIEIRRSPAPVASGLLATWTPSLALDGEQVAIRLSAKDLADNVATAAVQVTVDLGAPAAPIDLVASPAPSPSEDVILTWSPVPAADLSGYLVFRDGAALVAPEAPVVATTWTDPSVPDGTFTWTVVAIDLAGNQSGPSNPATLDLDRHPPHAAVVRPSDGYRFDGPLSVLATSRDRDVSSVLLEWRAPAGAWASLAPALSAEPWTATLDPIGLALERGPIELRAVATDLAGHIDPDPGFITAEWADLTAPPPAVDLLASIDGDTVTLTWDPVDTDAVRWRVEERFSEVYDDGVEEWTEWLAEVDEPSVVLLDVELGQHTWQVVAFDAADNESDASEPATGLVHRPRLARVLTPRLDSSLDLEGAADLGEVAVEIEIVPAAGPSTSLEVIADAGGAFSVPALTLTDGDQAISARVRDAMGNRSLPDTIRVLLDAVPETPSNLEVVVDELAATLGWDPTTEADHLGWRIARGTTMIPARGPAAIVAVLASDWAWPGEPEGAVDGDPESWWAPYDRSRDSLELEFDGPEIVESVRLTWDTEEDVVYAPTSVSIEAWDGRDWIPVASTNAVASSVWEIPLVRGYRTGRLRLAPRGALAGDFQASVRLSEVEASAAPALVGPSSYLDQPGDGHWSWEVEQVDTHAFTSDPATIEADVGDVLAPESVTLSGFAVESDVHLSWTASPSPDVVAYDLWRDGVLFARTPELAAIDSGRPNGTWTYEVRAIDGANNQSAASNAVPVVVLIEGPIAPTDLAVSPDPAGSALDLTWSWPAAEAPVGGYRVRRGLASGGPWESVGAAASTAWRDTGLENGTTYYYVVDAIDAVGNVGEPSNEASGTPNDALAPAAPVPTFPTISGGSIATWRSSLPFTAFAEEGAATVELARGPVAIASTTVSDHPSRAPLPFGVELTIDPAPDGSAYLLFESDVDCQVDCTDLAIVRDAVGGRAGLPSSVAEWRWLPDGSGLVGIDSSGLWRASPDGLSERVWTADYIGGAASVEVTRALVLAREMESGPAGVFEVDLESGLGSLLVQLEEAVLDSANRETVAAAPSGRHLAFSAGGALLVIDLLTGDIDALAETDRRPSWSPDGSRLAWSTWEGVFVLDLAAGGVMAFGELEDRLPVWSPDGSRLAVLDVDGRLVIRSWPDGAEVDTDLDETGWLLAWPADGRLLVTDFEGQPWTVTPVGLARFESIPLAAGPQSFRMTAIDAAGNRSSASGAFAVERLAPAAPDLVVPEFGIGVVPATPDVGEIVRVTASVHNAGQRLAAPSRLRAFLLDAVGTPHPVLDLPIGTLAPGETAVRDATVSMPGPAGTATLIVDADALGEVIEGNETNNRGQRAIPVGLAGAATLSVSTDAPGYGPGSPVMATAAIVGAGGAAPLRLEWRIVDSDGFPVAILPPVDLGVLAPGELRTAQSVWSHQAVLAGDYRVRSLLVDSLDSSPLPVAEASTDFAVLGWRSLAVAVVPRPTAIERGGSVDLDGRLEYGAGNQILTGLVVRLEVVQSNGAAELVSESQLGAMLPRSAVSVTGRWHSGDSPAGLRSVRMRLLRDGVELATASALLEVLPRPADLRGSIATGSPEAVLGDALDWTAVLRNLGDLSVDDRPIRVRLLDGSTLLEHAADSSVQSVAAGEEASFAGSFPTDDLHPGSLLLVLEAEVEGMWSLLDQHSVFAVDRTPPTLVALEPIPNGLLGFGPRLRARASDVHGDPIAVSYRVDGGAERLALPIDPAEATWGGSLDEIEGPHEVLLEAIDSWGNTTSVGPVPYEVDLAPPLITVLGVVDGQVGSDPVSPEIVVEDPHLDSWSATLDSASFISGTSVSAAGIHELLVVATDLVGNRSERLVTFTLSTAAVLDATLVDALTDDLDSDGLVSPGDELSYELVIGVEGATAFGLEAILPLPEGVSVVVGGVTTDRGIIVSEAPPTIALGDVASGEAAHIEIRTRVAPDPPAVIMAQGFLAAAGVPTLPTDDPALPGPDDPTLTVIGSRPHLVATKSGHLVSAAVGAVVGDHVRYVVSVGNHGSAAASEVEIQDLMPNALVPLPGTLTISRGFVTSFAPLHVSVGGLGPGELAYLEFEALLLGPLDPGATSVDNQGTVSASELEEPLLTDDPAVPGPADPTRVPLALAERPAATLVVDLLEDHDADGALGPDDIALYRLEVRPRTLDLADLEVTIPLPDWAVLDLSSVATDQGSVVGTAPLTISTASLLRGESWRITFEVTIGPDAPVGESELAVQATVADAGGSTLSDDPTTPELVDPTRVSTFAPSIVTATPVSILEGDAGTEVGAVIELSLAPSPREVRLSWITRDGSALAGEDYVAASGEIIIPPGATAASIVVTILGDDFEEGDEELVVELSDPVEVVIGTPTVALTILDDDASSVPAEVSVADASSVTEGDSLTFVVSRRATDSTTRLLARTTAAGSATPGTDFEPLLDLVVEMGPGVATAELVVATIDDSIAEWAQTVAVEIIPLLGAEIVDGEALGVIADDDGPVVLAVFASSAMEGQPIAATLSATPIAEYAVSAVFETRDLTATAGEDYVPHAAQTLEIEPGVATLELSVATLTDDLDEGDETLELVLSNAVDAELGVAIATATILDGTSALPQATLFAGEVGEASGMATVEVLLDRPATAEVLVSLATRDGSAIAGQDYWATGAGVVIAVGDLAGSFGVPLIDDDLHEPLEEFFVDVTSVNGAVIPVGSVAVAILDDDLEPLSASFTLGATVHGGPDAVARPGSLIDWSLELELVGEGQLSEVVVVDEIPLGLEMVLGSVVASHGVVTGLDPLRLEVAAIPLGEALRIDFTTRVALDLPTDVEELANQASVAALGLVDQLSDDPATAEPADPTIVAIEHGVPVIEIPAAGTAGLAVLCLILAAAGLLVGRRRQAAIGRGRCHHPVPGRAAALGADPFASGGETRRPQRPTSRSQEESP